jgi:hypothetical protein
LVIFLGFYPLEAFVDHESEEQKVFVESKIVDFVPPLGENVDKRVKPQHFLRDVSAVIGQHVHDLRHFKANLPLVQGLVSMPHHEEKTIPQNSEVFHWVSNPLSRFVL